MAKIDKLELTVVTENIEESNVEGLVSLIKQAAANAGHDSPIAFRIFLTRVDAYDPNA